MSNEGKAGTFPPSPPLVRGSIGHAGLAHLYARQRAAQAGQDPDSYYKPLEAMSLVAGTFGPLGAEMLPVACRAVKGYAEIFSEERWQIIGVEDPLETEFSGYRYTSRVDLQYRDRSGKIWFMDHKLVSKIEHKVYRRYILSGQFLGMIHIGARTYGDEFGGVQVNLLGISPQKYLRFVPEPAPYVLGNFPEIVRLAEEGIAALERQIAGGDTILASPSEHTCMGSYGECPAFEMCRWGGGVSLPLGDDEEGFAIEG